MDFRAVMFLVLLLCDQAASAAVAPPSFSPAGGPVKSPCAVTIHNPNPIGVISFTTDGTDPRDTFGNVATIARPYTEMLSVNRSMIVRARVRSGAEWSDLVAAPFTADQDFSQLQFTEVHFHPTDADDEFEEFIELKNVGPFPLNLSGLRIGLLGHPIAQSTIYVFSEGTTVGSGRFLVLVNNTAGFRVQYPTAQVDGEFTGELSNGFASMGVLGSDGSVAAEMTYQTHAPWQVVADNHGYFTNYPSKVGFSLVRATLDPAADPHDYRTWRASARRFGSPGQDDPAPDIPPVLVNEILARGSSGVRDTVELFNPTATNVNIGGWWLNDRRNWPYGYLIPQQTFVPAFGFLLLDERHFNVGENAFAFSGEFDRCYLFSGDTDGRLTGYSHGLEFWGSDRDMTFGRYVSSDGREHFPPAASRSLGGQNALPAIPPLVFSEVLYHPNSSEAQFVEVRNRTDGPLPLWDPTAPGTWAVGGEPFPGETLGPLTPVPPFTTLPPQGHLLFVTSDPTAFRAAWNVPLDVPIIQTMMSLSNRAAHLQLVKPSGVGNMTTRYVIVETLHYRNAHPWPAAAGVSIHRADLAAFADDPANWRAMVATPGRPSPGNQPPRVSAGGRATNFVSSLATLASAVWDDHWPGATLTSWWEFVSGPIPPDIQYADDGSATAMFSRLGTYTLRLNASDGAFSVSDLATFDVIPRPYDEWRRTNFTLAELANPSISGPSADPDADHLSTLAEYWLATNPKSADAAPWQVTMPQGRLEITWTERPSLPDLLIALERADRINGPWFGGAGLFETSTTPAAPGYVQVRLRETLAASVNRQQAFVRFAVTLR